MKKLLLVVSALVLVFGLSACKKEEEELTLADRIK
jgi:uncharacterized lipoprotein YehR (DUF1307 family)